ncbi:uncharacterized protein SPPG_07083 [Spizellomyces punctatus DAOM BR117]|uniref:Uncharacterized protein n=1 Tax=Spizellomyces punctatus (strain DAOM BR117) TaxID=645134 RepID=A0A0L0H7X7_SPIPD|nr:uncharacterized protein SPPG_07083 [Spizellomyces punctatus DAOM BR117]KNC97615.1 hypothetical protein SPPG_07083 [Spizellomyces punctatus DAOM BR117]|eukprot:XP_016605655.1 hypothetical protein SPPG_07083 [Spizellomyces punctatus DAOM BR117]
MSSLLLFRYKSLHQRGCYTFCARYLSKKTNAGEVPLTKEEQQGWEEQKRAIRDLRAKIRQKEAALRVRSGLTADLSTNRDMVEGASRRHQPAERESSETGPGEAK